ncbi:hypothetical protein DMUE_4653, partial [Dictyocoela muelleri]
CDSVSCVFCDTPMRLVNTKDNKLGYACKCFFNGFSKYKTTLSIFKNSFLSESRIESRSVLNALYYLSLGEPITSITEFTQIDKKNIYKIKSKLMICINEY